MKLVKLTGNIAVSAQITPEDVAAIAAAGYKVLINNRPDSEEAAQPSAAEIAASALAEGLEYHHMPVTAGSFPGPDFDAMSDLLDDPERPVLAFAARVLAAQTSGWLDLISLSERRQLKWRGKKVSIWVWLQNFLTPLYRQAAQCNHS